MELHAFDGAMPVAQAHDGAGAVFFGGPGADLEFGGEIFFFDDERVIACGRHGHGQALKDGSVVVHDGAGFAVHKIGCANYVAAEGFADGLVSEADSEDWNFSGEVADEIDADAGFARRARAGRNDNFFRMHARDFGHCDLIVAADFDVKLAVIVILRAQFADVLHQVVGERIVVVEDENHATSCLLTQAYTSNQGLVTRG
jgi:hypothetical protein